MIVVKHQRIKWKNFNIYKYSRAHSAESEKYERKRELCASKIAFIIIEIYYL